MTLTEKVRALVVDDGDDVFEGARAQPGGHRTEHESDLLEFGVVYGLAFGIARGEDPFEPFETVEQRAVEAARAVWMSYASESGLLMASVGG